MQDGLYKVSFKTPLGTGAGIVYLIKGKIRGGDSSIAYIGDYQVDNDDFAATVRTQLHTKVQGITSVFGKDSVNILLKGKVTGDAGQMTGTSPEAPGVSFSATFSRLSD